MAVTRDLTVLTGNGLSIACNGELALGEITKEATRRIEDEYPKVAALLQEIAEKQEHQRADADFEILVGAFGALGDTIDRLGDLAEQLDPNEVELRRALVTSALFARRTRDLGISIILEVIAERSVGDYDRTAGLVEVVAEILEEFEGMVAFANLNYDALLL